MILLLKNCWPLLVAGSVYLVQCGILLARPDPWQALTFFAYALANVGLIAVAMRGAT